VMHDRCPSGFSARIWPVGNPFAGSGQMWDIAGWWQCPRNPVSALQLLCPPSCSLFPYVSTLVLGGMTIPTWLGFELPGVAMAKPKWQRYPAGRPFFSAVSDLRLEAWALARPCLVWNQVTWGSETSRYHQSEMNTY
jgi:hypothetical protein